MAVDTARARIGRPAQTLETPGAPASVREDFTFRPSGGQAPFTLSRDPKRRGLGSTPERRGKASSASAAGSGTDTDEPGHRTTTRRAALAAFPLGNHPLVPMPGAREEVMTPEANDDTQVSRRRFLQGIGVAGVAATTPWLRSGQAGAQSGPELLPQPAVAGAPSPEQLHLQFGSDAAREVSASWSTPVRVSRPRLCLGRPGRGLGTEVDAEERTYTEALTGQTIFTYHASVDGLEPDTSYLYEVFHRGADAVGARFRTGPAGRSKTFRFTSFGDQSVPLPLGQGLGPWSPNAGYIVDAVEAADPLFHLLNGDLCYANVSDAPVETWSSFFNNNMRSARNRPWMPCAGNRENEVANGPQGYLAYQTRFDLPDNGAPEGFRGNWYAFTAGSMRVISINNDDVCIQDAAFSTYRRDHVPSYAAIGYNPHIR